MIAGVVGVLQMDVLEYRLKSEYGVNILREDVYKRQVQLKERLLDSDLASIIARGKKGGIPATVTLVNAILREISGKSIV